MGGIARLRDRQGQHAHRLARGRAQYDKGNFKKKSAKVQGTDKGLSKEASSC